MQSLALHFNSIVSLVIARARSLVTDPFLVRKVSVCPKEQRAFANIKGLLRNLDRASGFGETFKKSFIKKEETRRSGVR
ncbi:MAG: hypothetical protein QMD85_02610, partial [Candidatus Aenigmarchaeota archaeon]|nr:hypothetical protein [Candidatus Aenigmarchaeota archaeon]MDI6722438.1 hypothetical protein [Candidatus Aenigmarchaeota archaeon]